MNDIKWSMIVATNQGIEEINPLFITTDRNTEIIIIDSNYNEETKSFLKRQNGYNQIIYAPVKKGKSHFKRDFSQALNTALLFAEGKYIIRADDKLELHPDFFDIIEEDIHNFELYCDGQFGVIGRKLWGMLGEQKWDGNPNFPSRYTQILNPKFTFSFGIFPRNVMNILNGYSETFDEGWGFEDIHFLHRLFKSNYTIYFNKDMMAYSLPHTPKRFNEDITAKIYETEIPKIENGEVHADNDFEYKIDNPIYIKEMKEKYILKC